MGFTAINKNFLSIPINYNYWHW